MTYILSGLGVLGDLIGSIYEVCSEKTTIMHNNSFRTKYGSSGTKYGNGGLLNKK